MHFGADHRLFVHAAVYNSIQFWWLLRSEISYLPKTFRFFLCQNACSVSQSLLANFTHFWGHKSCTTALPAWVGGVVSLLRVCCTAVIRDGGSVSFLLTLKCNNKFPFHPPFFWWSELKRVEGLRWTGLYRGVQRIFPVLVQYNHKDHLTCHEQKESLTQPPTVVCNTEAQSDYVHIAYTYSIYTFAIGLYAQ